MIDISIIVSSWNRAGFLPDALDSIVQQDYQGSTQVIVCDDGSEDGTQEIIESYRNKFNEYVVINANPTYKQRIQTSRLAIMINRALPLCVGRYVCYLPDDDLYKPERNRLMAEYLDNNPDLFLVYHWVKLVLISEDKAVVGRAVDLCDEWDEANEFWVRNIANRIDHISFLHRNLKDENVLWDENIKYKRCTDWGFLLRALSKNLKFGSLAKELAIGRKIQGQSLNVEGNSVIEKRLENGKKNQAVLYNA